MVQKGYKVIGVMSGTSLDGIDLAYVEFLFDGQWQYRFLECETVPYDLYWQELLKNLVDLSPESLSEIDVSYTRYLSEIIRSFMAKHTIAHID
ncbi:MAG TPA: anhydro-N-acetylmuramic acid kinase, partial [Aquaticitalea sp.]|nr:anhydro-N-acetylmuramic acid kinase [Aquaticitalea sp.]